MAADFSRSRRNFLTLVGAGVTGVYAGESAQGQPQGDPPNIIWIMADDAGWNDFGCYGHPTVSTPNIDQIASEGVRFTNAFVTTPQCSPSRSSTWTGQYAHTLGTEDLHVPLPRDIPMITDYLSEQNYFTGNIGKLHLGKQNRNRFDYIIGEITDWRRFMNRRPKDRPFFLTLGFHQPHRPYVKNRSALKHDPEQSVIPPYLPDTRKSRLDMARYYDEITIMDTEIGRLLKHLRNHNIDENTIIVFWSDNGSPFPRAKGFLYDAGIGTPLIIRWKNGFEPGVRQGLTSTLDIAPTMLDILGIEPGEEMQGESFLSQILDENAQGREYIFTERNWHDIDDHVRSVRTNRYKYIRNYFPREPYPLPADVFKSPTFQDMRVMRDAGTLTLEQMLMFRWPRPDEELYDLYNDPNEFHNLAEDEAYQDVLQDLRTRTEQWQEETEDVPPAKRKPNRYDYETGDQLQS
ncbi:MAG: sulfatase-like hydrolase/transferase [Candidatus Marinimicrobia bacterium]|nr:sulfatase-like hydrolase/transferase [Candidatus Neomarinimicrobiota bacterium]